MINKYKIRGGKPPHKDRVFYEEEIFKLKAEVKLLKEEVSGNLKMLTFKNDKLFDSLKNELAERKSNEEELNKLNRAVENSPVSVLITDTSGNISYVNPWFSRVTGYSFEEVLGKNTSFLKSGKHDNSYYKNLWDTISRGDIWQGEFLNKKKNGEIYWEQASISPVFDVQGNIINYVAIKDDITEHKVIDTKLRQAKEEAERANASKSIFLANMSHEIRTPMNAILGFSQLLLRDSSISEQQREYLGIINRSGEHLLELINDILEMSKIEAGRINLNPNSFSLNEFVKDLRNLFRSKMDEKGLAFILENKDENLKFIVADENKLRQIFINIIGNALKFTDAGNIVWRINTVRIKETMYLISEIEDTGKGIAKEEIQRLFKAFEQTEVGINAGGTGLGLAISQKFAKLMGGEITVTSIKGKGSCFKLKIKIKKGHKHKRDEKILDNRVVGVNTRSRGKRILVVDDITENRSLLCKTLVAAGFQVFEAENGKEAIEKFLEINPNIILMDILMPVMDGIDATKIIRKNEKGKDVPIIAVTSSVFEKEKNEIMNSGVNGYLARPFKEKQLFEVIAQCIDIEYIYENEELNSTINKNKFDVQLMKELQQDLVEKMREATINGDSDKLLELIDEVLKSSPELGEELRVLANDYKYEELLILFNYRTVKYD